MSELLHVSSSPHIRSKATTSNIMLLVLIALLPATCFGIYLNGPYAAAIIAVSMIAAVGTEYLYEKLMHKKITVTDGSAAVTGLLLALNLPVSVPIWIPLIGSVFAILIVKQLFGGLGQNFMNPALAARCFLLISFASHMNDFSTNSWSANKIVDTVSGATPLAELKAGGTPLLTSMFAGTIKGTIGETSAAALLLGGIFLVVMKIIDLRIPLTYIGTFTVFYILFGGHGLDPYYIGAELCGGGLMLGAWFMATDYVTRPITRKGQYVYGIILGLLTGLFRIFGMSAEGVSYAIIFSNLLVPIIERCTRPSGFGINPQKGGKQA
ncbi:MAG: RnfABCDGE type electron transport complex subunit D [Lachnospiraceae bacterium]|nr:RnfABCDGE type electron transport complex subunit D [Lachnospiraceae bacterium]